MKIIIAPNALKGSLTSIDAAAAMAKGVVKASDKIEILQVPVADGGDGTLDIFNQSPSFVRHCVNLTGPDGRPITAYYLLDLEQKSAVIEMAQVSGLAVIQGQSNKPLTASSIGVGELILLIIEKGIKSILIGLGGSATTDAGTGLLTALGVKFLDVHGKTLPGNGLSLGEITKVNISDLDERLQSISFQVLCDVTNLVTGNEGAAKVFAPQKGATKQEVELLESGMLNFITVVKDQLGVDMSNIIGGGAAGGIGASLKAFLGAELLPGADTILDMLEFDDIIHGADLVLTAEGQLDTKTLAGKVPLKVASRSKSKGIPCIAIAGSVNGSENLLSGGFTACFSLCSYPMDLKSAMRNASALLSDTTEQIVRSFIVGKSD